MSSTLLTPVERLADAVNQLAIVVEEIGRRAFCEGYTIENRAMRGRW